MHILNNISLNGSIFQSFSQYSTIILKTKDIYKAHYVLNFFLKLYYFLKENSKCFD